MEFLLHSKQWEAFLKFPLEDIANELSFKKGIIIAYRLLYNEE